ESVIQKECGLIRIEFVRQNAARLQIGDLAGRQGNQFAYAFVESRRRSESQQVRNLRPRVSLEVVTMPELVMRGKQPPQIWFDALQGTNVVFKIDMEAEGVRVFLPFRIRRNGI